MGKIKYLLIILFTSFVYAETGGFAKNGDVEIYYIDYGPEEGTPVLLVQGLGGQLTFWPNELIEMFKENGFRPIVYDNRDVGLSHSFEEYGKPNFVWNYIKFYLRLPINSVYSLTDMSNDGIAVLDELEIEKSHVLAQSMGGMITQRMVADNNDRFISYVLIASMAETPNVNNSPKGELRDLIENRSFEEQSIEERVARSLRIFQILSSEGVVIDEDRFRAEAIKNIERSPNDSGFSRQLIAILADDNRFNEVKRISVPTLVIHGKLDPLVPFDEGKKTAESIPNSKFIAVEKMRHLIDEPVLEVIEDPLIEHLRNAEAN
jgi:pimeloyl-ACP methyl ester carboxylesterase|tara:strand:- start:866 stop:1825 length:960 start_codon:yes stop_codon:yes gene_type:complete